MSRYWPVAIVVVGAVVLLGLLAGEGMFVLGVSAGFAVLALVVVVMLSTVAADGQRRSDPRAQRRLREAAQAMPGAATAVPAAGGEPPRPAVPDPALAESRAEVERLGGELRRAREKEKEAEERARASAAAAAAAATAAAENAKRLEASVKEGRAEVDRLTRELAALRSAARTAEPPARPAVPAPAPAEPASVPSPPPAAAAASVAPAPTPAPPSPATAPSPPRPAEPPTPRPAPAVAPAPPLGPPLSPPSPPASGAPAAAPVPAAAAPAPSSGDGARGTGTLLFVDDDADFRTVAALILRRAGYEVLEAASGAAALEEVQRHSGSIDLLITDMMMPGMNGRQLAQRFTKLRPGVRILYVSGVVDEASAREAIAGEDADFLEKPFEGETFTTKVRELLPAAPRRE